jgi:hypothetical protein
MEFFTGAAARLVEVTGATGGASRRCHLGTDMPELADLAPMQGESSE